MDCVLERGYPPLECRLCTNYRSLCGKTRCLSKLGEAFLCQYGPKCHLMCFCLTGRETATLGIDHCLNQMLSRSRDLEKHLEVTNLFFPEQLSAFAKEAPPRFGSSCPVLLFCVTKKSDQLSPPDNTGRTGIIFERKRELV